MDQKTHDKGLEIRRGAAWGRDELPRKTRRMLNLAMIAEIDKG
jgi:alkylhydroperoxidase/carboxymuconolactone decarboxylase family protein YurZ